MRGRPSPQEGLRRRRDVLSGTRRYDRRVLDHLSIQCSDIAASDGVLRRGARRPRRRAGDALRRRHRATASTRSRPSGSARSTTASPTARSHIAFVAADRAAVRAWFDAAVSRWRGGAARAARLARVPPDLLRRVRPRPRRQQRRGGLSLARVALLPRTGFENRPEVAGFSRENRGGHPGSAAVVAASATGTGVGWS